jgi:DNA-binding NtrC family response regulator
MHIPPAEPCIYIVDDEAALASLTNRVLELRGYHAAVFNSPADAIAHLQQHPSDRVLLITDCIMGKMNGLELIEEFSKRVKDLRTILLSGTITGDFVRGCQVQPDRFLAKPYGPDALLDAVESLLPPKAGSAPARP